MTDVLNVSVTASAVSEASSRGAALLALEAIDAIPDIASLEAPTGHTYHPDRSRAKVYRRAAARQGQLYDVLIGSEPLPANRALPEKKRRRPAAAAVP
jgi:gluconokinase